MAAHYESKHGLVSKSPAELYMGFVDMRNFTGKLPDEYKATLEADYDTLTATVQGFKIGVKVTDRQPYSLIRLEDNDAPFHFDVTIHFDAAEDPSRTDFSMEVNADLNLMMKTMLGGRIKEGLDKAVDFMVEKL